MYLSDKGSSDSGSAEGRRIGVVVGEVNCAAARTAKLPVASIVMT